MNVQDENLQFQRAAQSWLFEMNLVNNPQAINILKMNILMVSNHIKECEILMSVEQSAILIWLDVPNRFVRWWLGEKGLKLICSEAEEVVNKLLPNFRVRVVEDKKIYNLALEKVRQALRGGAYETTSSDDDLDVAASSEG